MDFLNAWMPDPNIARAGFDPYGNAFGDVSGMGGGFGGFGGGGITDALRGVRPPAAPETQRVSTPSGAVSNAPLMQAPAPRQITPVRGGDILDLLARLSAPPPQVQGLRLAQALGGR